LLGPPKKGLRKGTSRKKRTLFAESSSEGKKKGEPKLETGKKERQLVRQKEGGVGLFNIPEKKKKGDVS